MSSGSWTYEGPWHQGRDGSAHTGGSADQCPDCLRTLADPDALRARIKALANDEARWWYDENDNPMVTVADLWAALDPS
jgi:hypothetical protein